MRNKPKTKYRTVQLPDKLVREVAKELEFYDDLGYRSHTEFIIDAVRRRVEKVRKNRRSKKTRTT